MKKIKLKIFMKFALMNIILVGCKEQEVKISYLYQPLGFKDFFEPLHGNVKTISVKSTGDTVGDYCSFDFDGKGNMLSSKTKSTYKGYYEGHPNTVTETESSIFKPVYRGDKAVGTIRITSTKTINRTQNLPSETKIDTLNLAYDTLNSKIPKNLTTYSYHHFTDTYKFDNKSRLLETSAFEEDVKLSTSKYQYFDYDKNHNWTKAIITYIRHVSGREMSTKTITRKIIYYQ